MGKASTQQEAELKNKAGTAWSHSYLNQKPWHPLSYPNQKRKWIAEQTHLQRERRAEDVAREFAQEQEFSRQTAMLSKKEQEKAEAMKALSFMYLRPPGYNAESARAAEIADEKKKLGFDDEPIFEEEPRPPPEDVQPERKKPRVLDIYGRPVPTEDEFPALKNAPRLNTGTVARAKPFGVEIRNVKCARCGNFGHQSGDRECAMKDAIMPNEQARLMRDDPLNAMMVQAVNNKWELKQQIGGMSPPRGGFKPDDPNQQIIAEDDVYNEYGGFLAGDGFAETIASLSRDRLKKNKKKREDRKRKKKRAEDTSGSESDRRKHRSRDRDCSDSERRKDRKHKRESKSAKDKKRSSGIENGDCERKDRDYSDSDGKMDRKHRSSDLDRKHRSSDLDRKHRSSDLDRKHRSSDRRSSRDDRKSRDREGKH